MIWQSVIMLACSNCTSCHVRPSPTSLAIFVHRLFNSSDLAFIAMRTLSVLYQRHHFCIAFQWWKQPKWVQCCKYLLMMACHPRCSSRSFSKRISLSRVHLIFHHLSLAWWVLWVPGITFTSSMAILWWCGMCDGVVPWQMAFISSSEFRRLAIERTALSNIVSFLTGILVGEW